MSPKPGPSRAATATDQPALPPTTRDSSAHPLDQSEPAQKRAKKPKSAPVQQLQGTGAPDSVPTPEEVQATSASDRRQFNIGVPKNLKLHRRAGLYAEDHGLSRQDQVALALDLWLRERGY